MTRYRLLFVACAAAVLGGPVSAADTDAKRLGGSIVTVARIVVLQAEIDSLKVKNQTLTQRYAESITKNETLKENNAELLAKNDAFEKQNAELLKKSEKLTELNVDLKAQNAELTKTGDALKDANAELRSKNADLEKSRDQALMQQLAAEREAKAARLQSDAMTKQYERLLARVEELKLSLPKDKPLAPPPPREGLRGTVEAYQDGLVVVSIGLDSGLAPGTELELSRTTGAKYLGTVTITEVTPKKAVGKFKPANNAAIKNLKADDLPRVGDNVGTKPKD